MNQNIRDLMNDGEKKELEVFVASGGKVFLSAQNLVDKMNQEISGASFPDYYVYSEKGYEWIISNVPRSFYEKSGNLYKEPVDVSPWKLGFMACVKQEIDACLRNKMRPNDCFKNSLNVHGLFMDMYLHKAIPKPGKLVIGILSRGFKPGTSVGDTLICHGGVVIQDIHAWNRVGGMLVDTTTVKTTSTLSCNGVLVSDWGVADDHIYIYPEEGSQYMGIEFDDANSFKKYANSLSIDMKRYKSK